MLPYLNSPWSLNPPARQGRAGTTFSRTENRPQVSQASWVLCALGLLPLGFVRVIQGQPQLLGSAVQQQKVGSETSKKMYVGAYPSCFYLFGSVFQIFLLTSAPSPNTHTMF